MIKRTVGFGTLALLALTAVMPLNAQNEEKKNDKEVQLQAQRREVELEMYKLRLEMIKTDPEISRLHEKILAMHKELQLKIDNVPAMQKLIRRAEQLDRDLRRTSDKK